MPKYSSEAAKVQTFSFLQRSQVPATKHPSPNFIFVSQPLRLSRQVVEQLSTLTVSVSHPLNLSQTLAHRRMPSLPLESSTHFHSGDFHRESYPATLCLKFPIVRRPASYKPSDYHWKIRRLSSNKPSDQQVNLANCEARSVSSKHQIPVSQWLSSTTF